MLTTLLITKNFQIISLKKEKLDYQSKEQKLFSISRKDNTILWLETLKMNMRKESKKKSTKKLKLFMINIGKHTTMILSLENFMTPKKKNNIKENERKKKSNMEKMLYKFFPHHTFTDNHWFWITQNLFLILSKCLIKRTTTQRKDSKQNM